MKNLLNYDLYLHSCDNESHNESDNEAHNQFVGD